MGYTKEWVLGCSMPVTETGCWIWMRSLDSDGYGNVAVQRDGYKGTARAHRISYELWNGAIPDGLVLDHLCRTPSCVNPFHLEAVSTRTNLLRGVGACAMNARKTHCKRGHQLSGSNLGTIKGGGRYCKSCSATANVVNRQKRRLCNKGII